MAFRVGTGFQQNVSGGSLTQDITVPAGVQSGDVGLLLVSTGSGTWTTCSATTSGAGTITTLVSEGGSSSTRAAAFVITGAAPGDTITFTVDVATIWGSIAAAWYSDVDATSLQQSAVTTRASNVSTTTTATIASAVAGDTVVSLFAEKDSGRASTLTASEGTLDFFQQGGTASGANCSSAFVSETQAASGATNAVTATYATGSSNAFAMQVLLPQTVVAGAGSASGSISIAGTATAVGVTSVSATGTITLNGSAVGGNVAPILDRVWLGIPDSDTIRCTAKVQYVSSARLAIATSAAMTSPTYSNTVTPDANGYLTDIAVGGLAADTAYWYQLELNGTLVGSPIQTKTLPTPGTPANFTLAFGSCVAVTGAFPMNVDPDTFATILARNPDEFWHLGDLSYPNNNGSPNGDYITDDPDVIRGNLEAGINTNLQALTAAVPSAHQMSDNDSGGGNCDAGSGAWPALSNGTTVSVTKQILSHPTLPDPNALYHSHMRGRVLIITIDDRTYSSGATVTDDANKTKLGLVQRAWLQDQLANAAANGAALVMIMAEDSWSDTGGTSSAALAGTASQNDGWGAYGAERDIVGGYIAALGLPVIWCYGDTHSIGLDDGTNNPWGGFPRFNAAPFYQFASAIDAANYSHGAYPPAQITNPNQQYYGWVDIQDDGVSLTVTCTAYDCTASAGNPANDVQRGSTMVLTSVPASAHGTISFTGSATGVVGLAGATAAGSLTLTGAAVQAQAAAVATGAVTLTGTAQADATGTTAAATANGALTLSGSAQASGVVVVDLYLYTPPLYKMPALMAGSLRVNIETCTVVYRQDGVWHNQADAGMDDPVVADCDVDPTGLRLFFDRPVVVPDTLHDELAALEPADTSWSAGTLTPVS